MLGPNAGLPIVVAPVNDRLGLAIAEGIEDGLSVFVETGLGVWAAGSAGNMPKPRHIAKQFDRGDGDLLPWNGIGGGATIGNGATR